MPLTIDDDGIQIQTLSELRAEMLAALRQPSPAGFGPDFVIDEAEPFPMLCTIVAERVTKLQEGLVGVLKAMTPGEASGIHADNIAGITGTSRAGGLPSTIAFQLTGDPNATIPAGRVFRHTPTGTLWDMNSAVLLDGGGSGSTSLTSQEERAIDITSSSDWTIALGDAALISGQSTADSQVGRSEESDAGLEARRKEEIARGGSSTAPAIRADLQQNFADLGYDGDVTVVFVNNRHIFDADGRPPGSVEVLLDDNGLIPDSVVAEQIWKVIAAGARPWGTVTETYTDDSGVEHDVGFSRSVDISIHLAFTISTADAEVPIVDQDGLRESIIAAVVADADTRHPAGRNVNPESFAGIAYDKAPKGSLTSVSVQVSDDGVSFASTPLAVSPANTAAFDVSRVTVVFS